MYSKKLTAVSKTAQDVINGTGNPANFVIRFNEAFVLAGKAADNKGTEDAQQSWEVALIEWRGFNSIANVSASLYGNHIFEYSGGGPVRQVIIPDGIYSVEQINALIREDLVSVPYPANSIVVSVNTSQGKVTISVAAGFTVNLNASNIFSFFGYDAAQSPIVGPATTIGNNIANITNGITAYLIRCDAVAGSVLNANGSDILYIYTPDVKPGRSIKVSPVYPVFLPVRNMKEISQIRLYITDDLGRPVDYRGDNVTYELYFRRVPKKIY